MTGPIGFHPEDRFEGVFSTDDSSMMGGDEETPSIANISSEMLFEIGVGAEPSGIDLCRATSIRSLVGWIRTND